jgi:hypothetical protein
VGTFCLMGSRHSFKSIWLADGLFHHWDSCAWQWLQALTHPGNLHPGLSCNTRGSLLKFSVLCFSVLWMGWNILSQVIMRMRWLGVKVPGVSTQNIQQGTQNNTGGLISSRTSYFGITSGGMTILNKLHPPCKAMCQVGTRTWWGLTDINCL